MIYGKKRKINKKRTYAIEENPVIHHIEETNDMITGRGGLAFFARYIEAIGIKADFSRMFGSMRKNKKGILITDLLKQFLCFFVDGTSRHLTQFDACKKDAAYAVSIGYNQETMASSHAVKRFLTSFSFVRNRLFRLLLHKLMVWRMKHEKPDIVILDIDVVLYNNDDAKKREGVKVTYAGIQGFAPLFIKWGPYVVDAVLRSGHKHSNNGDTVVKALSHLVNTIRNKYNADVPILITMDSGFFDNKLFTLLETLHVGYVAVGKVYQDIRAYAESLPESTYIPFEDRKRLTDSPLWRYTEWLDKRTTWTTARRLIYAQACCKGEKQVLFRDVSVFYTNLGTDTILAQQLASAGLSNYQNTDCIIHLAHQRGVHELVHRHLKDYADEQLPMNRFESNEAYFFCMLLSFFIYEAFKRDILIDIMPSSIYPTTFRRVFIDCAAKLIRRSNRWILKLCNTTSTTINAYVVWERILATIPICSS